MSLFRWLTVRAERLVATSACPVCRALIDPDGVVQHQRWHDTHTPLQRIGDPI